MKEAIVIKFEAKKYNKKIHAIIWKSLFKLVNKIFLLVIFCSGIILTLSFPLEINTSSTTTGSFFFTSKISFYFNNLFFGLGVGLTILSILRFMDYINQKSFLSLKLNSKYALYSNNFSYQLDSEGIIFTNNYVSIKRKWEFYSKFSKSENFLLLFSRNQNDRFPCDFIPVDIVSTDEMKKIISLLETKIK